MEKYTSGTGGGSGTPENFICWEKRDPCQNFSGYVSNTTWIHLADRALKYILYTKYEGLPQSYKPDGVIKTSPQNLSLNQRRREHELYFSFNI